MKIVISVYAWLLVITGSTIVMAQGIPPNKYGLPVVDNITLYRQLVATDSSQALVDLRTFIPGIKLDIRYATRNNFMHRKLYPHPYAYLRRAAAETLKEIQATLNKNGLGLLIFDAYRPYRVTEKMWEEIGDDRYVADPKKGSGHNRGVTVDLTLINLRTGKPVRMPSGYDDFTEKAHYTYLACDAEALNNRTMLRAIMEEYGFKAFETEWWHFFLKDYEKYPLMDIDPRDL
ncbi:MAG TPA: M15 family metallopeptidase [Chitinophaga sp.]|uniref:M15 family metallopeptidase n=1 Tax=Chitinophaga sp. TaxID=1869181 RepID=UPI002C2C27FA|nr:M15 family metallopeptidase [Chitinophaga sp.]HVI47182.1 M15 family metallopeptidase [Chitinophaga sp.]